MFLRGGQQVSYLQKRGVDGRGLVNNHAFLNCVCIPSPFGNSVKFDDLFLRLYNPVCKVTLPRCV